MSSWSGVLLWLDVETTGLVPGRDLLLEVAAVVTTCDQDFRPLDVPFQAVIHRDEWLLSRKPIDTTVRVMHERSGLWDEVEQATASEATVWADFDSWARAATKGVKNVYLAGRSVHFDRSWMSPSLMLVPRLSHRHFDLSPIKAFFDMLGFEPYAEEDVHRALPDVLADIALASRLVDIMRTLEVHAS